MSCFKNTGNKEYDKCLFRASPTNIDFRHALPSQARAFLWPRSIFSSNALISKYKLNSDLFTRSHWEKLRNYSYWTSFFKKGLSSQNMLKTLFLLFLVKIKSCAFVFLEFLNFSNLVKRCLLSENIYWSFLVFNLLNVINAFFLSIFLETVLHEVYSRLYSGKYILVVEYRFVTTEKALIRKLRSRGENFENWVS